MGSPCPIRLLSRYYDFWQCKCIHPPDTGCAHPPTQWGSLHFRQCVRFISIPPVVLILSCIYFNRNRRFAIPKLFSIHSRACLMLLQLGFVTFLLVYSCITSCVTKSAAVFVEFHEPHQYSWSFGDSATIFVSHLEAYISQVTILLLGIFFIYSHLFQIPTPPFYKPLTFYLPYTSIATNLKNKSVESYSCQDEVTSHESQGNNNPCHRKINCNANLNSTYQTDAKIYVMMESSKTLIGNNHTQRVGSIVPLLGMWWVYTLPE